MFVSNLEFFNETQKTSKSFLTTQIAHIFQEESFREALNNAIHDLKVMNLKIDSAKYDEIMDDDPWFEDFSMLIHKCSKQWKQ